MATIAGVAVSARVTVTSGNQVTYQWYTNTTNSTTNGTPIPGAVSATVSYAPQSATPSVVYMYCIATNGCTGNPTGTSPVFTVNVSADPATMLLGAGTFSGKTCFDINKSNDGGNCGLITNRTPNMTNFATLLPQDYVFTASTTGTKQNLRFVIVDDKGAVQSTNATSVAIPGTVANSQVVTLSVTYKNTLSDPGSIVWGKTSTDAIKVQIYAVYNNGSTDVAVPLTVKIQDCACCGAYIAPNIWKNFMCHNLGADQSLDPSKPAAGLTGSYYQYGQKTPVSMSPYSGWVAVSPTSDLWDRTKNPANPLKGVNDPCPDGYRVPTKAEWAGVVNNPTKNTFAKVGTWTTSTAAAPNLLQIGAQLYLPMSGMANGSTLYGYNQLAYYVGSDTLIKTTTGTASMTLFQFSYSTFTPTATSPNFNMSTESASVRCIEQ